MPRSVPQTSDEPFPSKSQGCPLWVIPVAIFCTLILALGGTSVALDLMMNFRTAELNIKIGEQQATTASPNTLLLMRDVPTEGRNSSSGARELEVPQIVDDAREGQTNRLTALLKDETTTEPAKVFFKSVDRYELSRFFLCRTSNGDCVLTLADVSKQAMVEVEKLEVNLKHVSKQERVYISRLCVSDIFIAKGARS